MRLPFITRARHEKDSTALALKAHDDAADIGRSVAEGLREDIKALTEANRKLRLDNGIAAKIIGLMCKRGRVQFNPEDVQGPPPRIVLGAAEDSRKPALRIRAVWKGDKVEEGEQVVVGTEL